MSNKTKRFISCFISGVEIDDKKIVLENTGHMQYIIDRATASIETLDNFKTWFSDVYLKCIPATSTIIDYDIAEDSNGECIMLVNKLISPLMGSSENKVENANG